VNPCKAVTETRHQLGLALATLCIRFSATILLVSGWWLGLIISNG
jgi:hypothetical protein